MKLLKFETIFFILAILFSFLIYFFFSEIFENNIQNQFLLFLLPLIWPGIAHGSLDLEIAKKLNLIKNKKQLFLFLSTYILFIIVFIYIWSLSSSFGLFIFFLISIYHFGSSDSFLLSDSIIYKLEVFIRGSLPLCIPSYFYKNDVSEILDYLLIEDYFIELTIYVLNVTLFFCFIALLLVMIFLYFKRCFLKNIYISFFIEITLVTVCFMNFDPLVSFSLYFCFLHSLRHLINEKENLGFSFPKTISKTIPFTLIATAGLILVYFNFDFYNVNFKFLPLLFIGLASLTVPHMILISISKSINKPS